MRVTSCNRVPKDLRDCPGRSACSTKPVAPASETFRLPTAPQPAIAPSGALNAQPETHSPKRRTHNALFRHARFQIVGRGAGDAHADTHVMRSAVRLDGVGVVVGACVLVVVVGTRIMAIRAVGGHLIDVVVAPTSARSGWDLSTERRRRVSVRIRGWDKRDMRSGGSGTAYHRRAGGANTTDDGELLKRSLDRQSERDMELEEMTTDGGFTGPTAESACVEHETELRPT